MSSSGWMVLRPPAGLLAGVELLFMLSVPVITQLYFQYFNRIGLFPQEFQFFYLTGLFIWSII